MSLMKIMTRSTSNSYILNQILVRVKKSIDRKQDALAVFDLDSTLFDVSPRIQEIINQFAQNPDNQQKYPESCEILKTCKTLPSDWGIKNALIRAGLDDAHHEFQKDLKDFWLKCFFSNEYLEYDVPYDGAVEYVNKLHQMGCHIVYLTGRDIPRMHKGTISVLKKWNFPIETNTSTAVLKPEKGLDDAIFKSEFFVSYDLKKFPGGIWFFENEPMNINLIVNNHQHVEIVFFDSTHAGVENVHKDLPKILHYVLD